MIVITLIMFCIYTFIHDVLIKLVYCKWKKNKNNGFRCYYWTCKNYRNCTYNGTKKRNVFGFERMNSDG